MKNRLLILFLVGLYQVGLAQKLETNVQGDIEYGPILYTKESKPNHLKSITFDSTFVFYTDTISLPFFDDFSLNNFQYYTGDFNNPSTTSQTYYRLLDAVTNIPLGNQVFLTNQVTFRRVYDIVAGTTTDIVFNTINVKESNLISYPPTYTTYALYPPYYIFDTVGVQDVSDTIWINNPAYYQDSASIFFLTVNDPSKLWADRMAYHNYRYGVNPRSLGMATFDGLDEDGYPYQFGTSVTNYGDRLTCKPINMSSYSIADSIYLSFLYQPQGLGDIPENTDSLILEFYAPLLNQWFHIWSIAGSGVHPFKGVHIPITDTKFLENGFKFRFKNYGGLSGSLDHFHIDYVHLRDLSTIDDTLFKDFAFSYPLVSLLNNFSSVPWDHYKASTINRMNTALEVKVYNGSNTFENYQDGQIVISQNGINLGNFTLPGQLLAEGQLNYSPNSLFTSIHDLTASSGSQYQFPNGLIGDYQTFKVKSTVSAQFPNLQSNDTCAFIQGFYNYYSYDDGSAEAAFGPTGAQSMLAVHYQSYEADSLLGIDMHFVPSVVDVSNNLFLMTVWSDNNGIPGTVIYEDDAFTPRQPTYANGLNNFNRYYFPNDMKIPVGNSFFIGWRQVDPDRYNLGLDRNIDRSSEIFYSVDFGANWANPPFSGSAMIRPVFSTALDDELDIVTIDKNEKYNVFPNPNNGAFTIISPFENETGFTIMDLQGRVLLTSLSKEVHMETFPSGWYLIQSLKHPEGIIKVLKHD